ncbi:guanylate kinase-like isoform X1 [Dendronephthya gigantea]|uniref:guanylate kinase-like isoform X1 n=1 Tax=Dendronephthya gigantea TaxID=151771 RepID=UPI00106A55ED|nr:guanylate kinase-like isoform X1 [Dendronephthya gigantea]
MYRIFSKIYIFGGNRSRYIVARMSDLKLLVVSGPSGSGKSTLLKKLLKEYPNKCGFSVSHTTRNPRPGETNGKDYHFCKRDFMEEMIKNGEFLEHAEYSGNLYGTSKKAVKDVQDQGKICILDVDRQGVLNVKSTDMESHFLFIKPPSMQELEKRLRNRKTETEDTLQRRLNIAKADLEYAAKPDSYDSIVVNDVLEESYIEFKEIIKKAICQLD